jgi:hypothetical protein
MKLKATIRMLTPTAPTNQPARRKIGLLLSRTNPATAMMESGIIESGRANTAAPAITPMASVDAARKVSHNAA